MFLFFFNDPPTTEIYTLSLTRRSSDLHESNETAMNSIEGLNVRPCRAFIGTRFALLESLARVGLGELLPRFGSRDRKSTRLNSSHANISYAVFCLKKKKTMPPSR